MSGFSRSAVLTVLTVIEAMVLLFVVSHWYSRKWGWRNTFSGVRGYVRATIADLIAPGLQLYRFSRGMRLIGNELADPDLPDILQSAIDSTAGMLSGTPDIWPYAALIRSHSIALALAGPAPAVPVAPWKSHDGWWTASRADIPLIPFLTIADPARRPCPVAVGTERDGVLLIDLNRTPGVLEISGPARPVSSLICGIAAQFSTGMGGSSEPVEVLVSAGVHPRFNGPPMKDLLDQLSMRAEPEHRNVTTVLICGRIDRESAGRVADLCSRLPMLRVVTAGPYLGTCWRLPLTGTGRIDAPELGFFTDAAPLERGIERALNARAGTTRDPRRSISQPVAPTSATFSSPADQRPAPRPITVRQRPDPPARPADPAPDAPEERRAEQSLLKDWADEKLVNGPGADRRPRQPVTPVDHFAEPLEPATVPRGFSAAAIAGRDTADPIEPDPIDRAPIDPDRAGRGTAGETPPGRR